LTAAAPTKSRHDWRRIVEPVQPFLRAVAQHLAEQVQAFEPEIAVHAGYALTNQGKQLRPALVALSAQATGGLNSDLVKVAAIIEMVHLATLVHDDVMDEAEIRRRRPTLAANCGNTISVLVGDCLFAHAVQLAAEYPTPFVCRAVAAATKTVCTGEIIQTQRRRQLNLTRKEYFRVLRMKTAELFALSCELGAKLSGASEAEQFALRDYGMALGTAYQVYDDCLDLFGREASVGKSLGTDLASGKLTLPLITALDRTSAEERKELEHMLLHWNGALMPRLLDLLLRHRAVDESKHIIREFCDSARTAVQALPANEGKAALLAVADFLTQETDDLGMPLD
jgi:octaprenyl-diphosphate synthase